MGLCSRSLMLQVFMVNFSIFLLMTNWMKPVRYHSPFLPLFIIPVTFCANSLGPIQLYRSFSYGEQNRFIRITAYSDHVIGSPDHVISNRDHVIGNSDHVIGCSHHVTWRRRRSVCTYMNCIYNYIQIYIDICAKNKYEREDFYTNESNQAIYYCGKTEKFHALEDFYRAQHFLVWLIVVSVQWWSRKLYSIAVVTAL